MSSSASERRLAENEVFFKERNQAVQDGFDELKKMAVETNQESLVGDTDIPLRFYCECSDENCRQRVVLRPSEYAKIHENRNNFVVLPGHSVPAVEQLVMRKDGYDVVQKLSRPPEKSDRLHKTDTHNI